MGFDRSASTYMRAFFQMIILIALVIWGMQAKDGPVPGNWEQQIGYLALILMANQIISLWNCGCRFTGFEMWFIVFFYLFMFGQVMLKGVFGVSEIESTGYTQTIMDPRYNDSLMYKSAIFIICCIQAVACGLIRKKTEFGKNIEQRKVSSRLYKTGIVLLIIGIPCHLWYSIDMVFQAQAGSSYDAIEEGIGLIDDFANFLVPGMLCIIFSNKISKLRMRFIIAGVLTYLALVMITTGDRRYQTVTMIVLILAYMRGNNIRFSLKQVWLVAAAMVLLNGFVVLRNIRTNSLVGVGDFFSAYGSNLFAFDNNVIYQTMYEFGVSFYTVCLAIKNIPAQLSYRFGATLISGGLTIIPVGFVYQDWDIYTFGRIAPKLMQLGRTSVGGSMIADAFGNFGWLGGIVFSFLIGVFFKKVLTFKRDTKNVELQWAKYYTVFYACIHLVRASFSEVIRTIVWGVGILYIVYFLVFREDKKGDKKTFKK